MVTTLTAARLVEPTSQKMSAYCSTISGGLVSSVSW